MGGDALKHSDSFCVWYGLRIGISKLIVIIGLSGSGYSSQKYFCSDTIPKNTFLEFYRHIRIGTLLLLSL